MMLNEQSITQALSEAASHLRNGSLDQAGHTLDVLEFVRLLRTGQRRDKGSANGSRTMSPANENSFMSRSANATGKGAGCPFLVDSPLMSAHDERSQLCISSLLSIESALWTVEGERYSLPFRRKRMYSTSFLMIAPG